MNIEELRDLDVNYINYYLSTFLFYLREKELTNE